ncbi:MAG: hypothetical protein NPIRA05_07450 [Nitrospirales bacterium]|nr:MAG: hypothetical protein NPIRA05_07450 [Nitrospirales bacterium]
MKQDVLSVDNEIKHDQSDQSIDPLWPHQVVEKSPAFCFNDASRAYRSGYEENTQDKDIDDGHCQIV